MATCGKCADMPGKPILIVLLPGHKFQILLVLSFDVSIHEVTLGVIQFSTGLQKFYQIYG